MSNKRVTVIRFSPARNTYEKCVYNLPSLHNDTILQALQYINEELDPTLAFRYGCRYNHCGLCGVMVDGKPRLACKVNLDGANVIAPLANLPLLRDLVVDRSAYFKTLLGLKLYPQHKKSESLGELREEGLHKNLMHCLECLCCVASCPKYSFADGNLGNPYVYVKLAQLHLDPRDQADRVSQAYTWGRKRCFDCKRCVCPNGIHLRKALEIF
ncbi:MAG: 2Fe-2S iron-sulfur cluster-binding protein [Firmicutes bacterium]|nr:2Fe-2S iron-sulfur cluster-binding protein [Bacillota bacterium]